MSNFFQLQMHSEGLQKNWYLEENGKSHDMEDAWCKTG